MPTLKQIAANQKKFADDFQARYLMPWAEYRTLSADDQKEVLACERRRYFQAHPKPKAAPRPKKYATNSERLDAIKATKRKSANARRAAERTAKPAKQKYSESERKAAIRASKKKSATKRRATQKVVALTHLQ